MSDSRYQSWFHSNIMSGANHFVHNITQPFDWVDSKVNLLRRIPVFNTAVEYMRDHGADTAAIVAAAVAAYYGGSYLAAGSEGGAGAGAGAAGGTAMGGAAGELGAVDSAAASEGLGLTAADVGGTSSAGLTSVNGVSSAPAWAKWARLGGNAMQQMGGKKDDRPLEESDVKTDTPPLQNPYATSSKAAKTLPTGDVSMSLARGAAGTDAIDQAGVQMAAVQELSKRLRAAQARLAELQKERA